MSKQISSGKPRVLFVPLHPTSLYSMMAIARALDESGRGLPVVLITTSDLDRRTAVGSTKLGIHVVRLTKSRQNSKDNHQAGSVGRFCDLARKLVVAILPNATRHDLKDLFELLAEATLSRIQSRRMERRLRRQIQRLTPIIKKVRPVSIVTPGDRHLGWEPAVLAVARFLGVPVVIPPISQPALPENLSLIRKRRVDRASKFVRRRWPEHVWFNRHSNRFVSYYRPSVVRALHNVGVLSANPKGIGGGMASSVLVDGNWTVKRLTTWGVPKDKLVVTGKLEHDLLYQRHQNRETYKNQVGERYQLAQNSPIVIAALPQLGEHHILPWDQHWLVQHEICRTLSKYFDNVLLSLHPKMEPDQYRFLEEKYGVILLRDRLDEVLPAADVFVVGQGSSTALWSILCEIPTVVCDWYGLDLRAFESFESLKLIKSVEDFRAIIDRLSCSASYRRQLSDKAVMEKASISPFDGLSTDRILSAVLEPNLQVGNSA